MLEFCLYIIFMIKRKENHEDMKIYFFYRMINGLEPAMSAFTANKEKARLFKEIRKGYYYKEVEGSEKEYDELLVNHEELLIELHSFHTSYGLNKCSVILPATFHEIKEIIFHKDDLVLAELQKHVLPPDLFNDSIKESLYEIGYAQAHQFIEETGYMGTIFKNEPLRNFEVDELGLFLCLHKDTLNEKEIKGQYESMKN